MKDLLKMARSSLPPIDFTPPEKGACDRITRAALLIAEICEKEDIRELTVMADTGAVSFKTFVKPLTQGRFVRLEMPDAAKP